MAGDTSGPSYSRMYDSRDDDNHWDLPLVKFVSDAGEASFLFTLASASKSSFQGYGTRYRGAITLETAGKVGGRPRARRSPPDLTFPPARPPMTPFYEHLSGGAIRPLPE